MTNLENGRSDNVNRITLELGNGST